jgi:hypothetical protein
MGILNYSDQALAVLSCGVSLCSYHEEVPEKQRITPTKRKDSGQGVLTKRILEGDY